jgi:hypothetical protein
LPSERALLRTVPKATFEMKMRSKYCSYCDCTAEGDGGGSGGPCFSGLVDPIIKLTAVPHPFRIQRFESKRKSEAPPQDEPNKVNLGISDIPSQTPEKLNPVKGTGFSPYISPLE